MAHRDETQDQGREGPWGKKGRGRGMNDECEGRKRGKFLKSLVWNGKIVEV